MLSCLLLLSLLRWAAVAVANDDWPMLAHDPSRSGATAAEIRPPFERKWNRLFPDEGGLAWSVQTGAAIWKSPAMHNNLLMIGSRDGKLYMIPCV